MKRLVTIAGVQARAGKDITANMTRAMRMVRSAAKSGAQIICLQELYRTPYFPQHQSASAKKLAEPIPGESTAAFSQLARELGVAIIVPVFERARNGKYYNSAAVIDEQGRLLPSYRKMHIPQDPLFYEKNFFSPGASNSKDGGWRIYKTKFANFAVLICYDQWFPEAAREAALAGTEIIFYPTAIGNVVGYHSADGDWHDAWETVMRGHAIANAVHVVAVNRVGREDKLRFWGQSFACDSFGKVLERASASKEELLMAKLDLAHNQRIREGWGFFRNRRPDAYVAGASSARKLVRRRRKRGQSQ